MAPREARAAAGAVAYPSVRGLVVGGLLVLLLFTLDFALLLEVDEACCRLNL